MITPKMYYLTQFNSSLFVYFMCLFDDSVGLRQ